MESIELVRIEKNNNKVVFTYKASNGLSRFFSQHKFVIEYPMSVESIPDSILAIPFVSNVIHIGWITNSNIVIPSLDRDFVECLPNLKKAFSNMFPETNFSGNILVGKIEHNRGLSTGRAGMFYSGGVDSFQTLLTHLHENIDAVSIWGSDIEYENEKGWKILDEALFESLEPFKIRHNVIHSSFRIFNNEGVLQREFSKQLKDSWWHGLQHGIGLLGHAAPLAFYYGYTNFYIASTHSTHDTNVRCSSNPSTDNCVRFCGCQVIHDGFNYKRQDKIKNIVDFTRENPQLKINLHVCWENQSGNNCCSCEKCARTIYAILVEGCSPNNFGFNNYTNIYSVFGKNKCLSYLKRNPHLYHAWFDIADRILTNKDFLKEKKYWKNIKWLVKIQRNNPKSILVPNSVKIKHLIHRIISKIIRVVSDIRFGFYIIKESKENQYFLLGTPTHCNIGDAAIAEAEIKFIKDTGFGVTEISTSEWEKHRKVIKRLLKDKIVLLHGGGNFGNLWPKGELLRQDIVKTIAAKKFILLPQTFYLTDFKDNETIKAFKNVYDNERITLLAREKFSFEKMKNFFPNATVLMVPDIVLYLKNNGMLNTLCYNDVNKHVLLVLRNDKESIIDYYDKKDILFNLENKGYLVNVTDMYHTRSYISKEERMQIVMDKILEFSKSKLVITDRLHGMLFAYLAGVPCVVLANNHYKVKGVYQWISDISSTVFANSLEEIFDSINKLSEKSKNTQFNDELFEPLKKILLGKKDAVD